MYFMLSLSSSFSPNHETDTKPSASTFTDSKQHEPGAKLGTASERCQLWSRGEMQARRPTPRSCWWTRYCWLNASYSVSCLCDCCEHGKLSFSSQLMARANLNNQKAEASVALKLPGEIQSQNQNERARCHLLRGGKSCRATSQSLYGTPRSDFTLSCKSCWSP